MCIITAGTLGGNLKNLSIFLSQKFKVQRTLELHMKGIRLITERDSAYDDNTFQKKKESWVAFASPLFHYENQAMQPAAFARGVFFLPL